MVPMKVARGKREPRALSQMHWGLSAAPGQPLLAPAGRSPHSPDPAQAAEGFLRAGGRSPNPDPQEDLQWQAAHLDPAWSWVANWALGARRTLKAEKKER